MEKSNRENENESCCEKISKKTKILIIIFVCFLFLIALIIPLMALDYSRYDANVDRTTLFFQGNYMTGLGHHFITFPMTIQYIIFDHKQTSNALRCYTQDALKLDVNISTQYTLKQNLLEVLSLYNKYGNDRYQNAFASFVKDVVCSAFSMYTSEDFFKNRSRNNANLISFQLLDINIPKDFNDVLIITENRNLSIETAKFKQNLINTKLGGQKILASNTVIQLDNETNKLRTKYQTMCYLRSNKKIETLNQIKPSLLNLKSSLLFSNKDLIAYLFANKLNIYDNADENGKKSYINLSIPKSFECISDSTLNQCK